MMWRRFWRREEDEAGASRSIASAYAPDVLLANWVAPVEFTAVHVVTPVAQALQGEQMPTDTGAFLSRVYANQEC